MRTRKAASSETLCVATWHSYLAQCTWHMLASYKWQQTPRTGGSWGNACQALRRPEGGRRGAGQQSSWEVKEETGGLKKPVLLCSCNRASPTRPPGLSSPRPCAPSSSCPAAGTPGGPCHPHSRSEPQGPSPRCGEVLPPESVWPRVSRLPGTHGVKVSADRERSARTPLQPTETDPTDASTPAAPDRRGRPPHSRTPNSLPAKVPHAVKNQLQVAGPHGAAAHLAPKPDAPNSPRSPPSPPAPPRPAAACPGPPQPSASPRVRVIGTRVGPSSPPVSQRLSPHQPPPSPSPSPSPSSLGFSPPPGPLPIALWSTPEHPRGRVAAAPEGSQGVCGGVRPTPHGGNAARLGLGRNRHLQDGCLEPRLSNVGDPVCGSASPRHQR